LANSAFLEPNRLYADRALRKFPDHQDGAQDESDVKHCFKHSAPFLFRAYQKSICRFELIVHKRFVVHAIRYAGAVPETILSRNLLITKIMQGSTHPNAQVQRFAIGNKPFHFRDDASFVSRRPNPPLSQQGSVRTDRLVSAKGS
jgi:hypothetical protein